MLPEPYWDFNMVSDQFNQAEMKKYLNELKDFQVDIWFFKSEEGQKLSKDQKRKCILTR